MNMLPDLSFLQDTQIVVPFLFTLAITFGTLELTRLFRKPVNFLIALALSMFAITSPTFVSFLWSSFGDITIFFIGMFLIAFVLEAVGVRGRILGGSDIVIQSGILFLLLTLGFYYSEKIPAFPLIGGGQNVLLLLAVAIIFSIFWTAYKMQAAPPAK